MTLTPLSTSDLTKNTVRNRLTDTRARGTVENKDFAAFAQRVLSAHSRRVANGDIEALADLLALEATLTQAVADAVAGLREFSYSWADIGRVARITRQAAHEKWGGQLR